MHGTNNFAIACLVYQITSKVELVVLFPEVASKTSSRSQAVQHTIRISIAKLAISLFLYAIQSIIYLKQCLDDALQPVVIPEVEWLQLTRISPKRGVAKEMDPRS